MCVILHLLVDSLGFIECLYEAFSISVDELLEGILHNDNFSKECLAMAEALILMRQKDAA